MLRDGITSYYDRLSALWNFFGIDEEYVDSEERRNDMKKIRR